MGFLDNLESSLNSLERQDERDHSLAERRIQERSQTLAAAPSAEELKTSRWTEQLYERAALAGHRIRAKVYIAWIGTTLRLEVKGQRLDLVPQPITKTPGIASPKLSIFSLIPTSCFSDG
jgi:hypothetical protein